MKTLMKQQDSVFEWLKQGILRNVAVDLLNISLYYFGCSYTVKFRLQI